MCIGPPSMRVRVAWDVVGLTLQMSSDCGMRSEGGGWGGVGGISLRRSGEGRPVFPRAVCVRERKRARQTGREREREREKEKESGKRERRETIGSTRPKKYAATPNLGPTPQAPYLKLEP